LVAVDQHLKKRREAMEELTKLCTEVNFEDAHAIDPIMAHLYKLVNADAEFLSVQLALYKKDLKDASAELVSIQKESEEKTKVETEESESKNMAN